MWLFLWRHPDSGSHTGAIYVGENVLDVGIVSALRFQSIQRWSASGEFSPCLDSRIGPKRRVSGPDFDLLGGAVTESV